MKQPNQSTTTFLIVSLIIATLLCIYWVRYRQSQEHMTNPSLNWKDVSGENEFRNLDYQDETSTQPGDWDSTTSFGSVPLESDAIYLTGMNKYLWHNQQSQ